MVREKQRLLSTSNEAEVKCWLSEPVDIPKSQRVIASIHACNTSYRDSSRDSGK